ncbi:MAG: hypothetical protein WDW38_010082 [Sanguina aurantia]
MFLSHPVFGVGAAITAISGLNTYNFLFLMVGALLHWRPRSFLDAVARAVPATTGVLIQFPLYGSIAALMTTVKGSDAQTLAHHIATFFTHIASHETYAVLMGIYSAVLGFSCCTCWSRCRWAFTSIARQYVMQVANDLKYHLGWAVQIYNAAEALKPDQSVLHAAVARGARVEGEGPDWLFLRAVPGAHAAGALAAVAARDDAGVRAASDAVTGFVRSWTTHPSRPVVVTRASSRRVRRPTTRRSGNGRQPCSLPGHWIPAFAGMMVEWFVAVFLDPS